MTPQEEFEYGVEDLVSAARRLGRTGNDGTLAEYEEAEHDVAFAKAQLLKMFHAPKHGKKER